MDNGARLALSKSVGEKFRLIFRQTGGKLCAFINELQQCYLIENNNFANCSCLLYMAENWEIIKNLFHTALELEPAQRPAFLAAKCAGNTKLRSAVERLISAHEAAGSFIAVPAAVAANLGADNEQNYSEDVSDGERADEQIGNYKIIREIGRGGMGAVYLAQRADGEFAQKVAIKIVKRGMDTDFVVSRFRQERRILAALEHPHIARLIDGGTTADGLPFFVMEYVDGIDLIKFCDHRNLNLNERLSLFRKVCGAVAYAHQNLIVHRDLKPSNILVTSDGAPKLLDFGIAKLLQADDAAEGEAAKTTGVYRLFTPEYAAPEQKQGEQQITTAADVYSLGVIFSELVGSSQLRRSAHKTDEAGLTTDSGLRKNLKTNSRQREFLNQDLAVIARKSKQPEAARRYQTVLELSEDVRRYAVGLPLLARPDSVRYRLAKFVERHRLGVLATSFAALLVLGAASVAVWQAAAARREKAFAEQRFNQVRKLANTVLFDYHERIKDLPGATDVRKRLVTDALEYLDNLAQTSDNAPDLQRDLALAYRKIAQIQDGFEGSGNTGETNAARENYRKALMIQEKLVAGSAANDADRNLLAKLYLNLDEQLPEAVAILAQIAGRNPDDPAAQSDLARGWWSLAEAARAAGNYDEAIENYRRAGDIYEKLAVIGAEKRASHLRNAALIHKNIGGVFEQKGEYPKTLEIYQRALAIDRENAAANPNNAQYQLDLSFTYNSIASSLANTNDFDGALENCQEAFKIQEQTVAADPQNAFAKFALARTYRRLGDIQTKLGGNAAASYNYQKSIEMFQAMIAADPGNADKQSRLAEVYERFASFRADGAGKLKTTAEKILWLRDAQTLQKRGIEILKKLESEKALSKWSEQLLQELQTENQKISESLATLTTK